ncbi:MAG TPA: hypothetical protein VFR30_01955 [Lysobacter sp.]|nr:hypothetical protein [Lysobacter sp.]
MKRLMISLFGALAFAAAAQAAEPQANPVADTAPVTQEADKPDLDDRNCLRQTGTRIGSRNAGSKDQKCTGAMGRSYTREDLERTGDVNIADALRKLDPAIR